MTPNNNIRYVYIFRFEDGTEKRFEIMLDGATFRYHGDDRQAKPEWTKLHHHQCENCPLADTVEYCPVAVNLVSIVEAFQENFSYDKTEVRVETRERTYTKNTSLQKGLSSILGIIMPTSDCPVMDKLRPMAPFHLPFATPRETTYRVLAMFLMAQHFRRLRGEQVEDDLKPLLEIYREVAMVNRGISQRLVEVTEKDASPNAIVILHSLSDSLRYSVEGNFDELQSLFTLYFNNTAETQKPVPETS